MDYNRIAQGSTPLLYATIPDELDVRDIDKIEMTIKYGNSKKIYREDFFQKDVENNAIYGRMPQEDTIEYERIPIVNVQFRFVDANNEIIVMEEDIVAVADLLSDEVIE